MQWFIAHITLVLTLVFGGSSAMPQTALISPEIAPISVEVPIEVKSPVMPLKEASTTIQIPVEVPVYTDFNTAGGIGSKDVVETIPEPTTAETELGCVTTRVGSNCLRTCGDIAVKTGVSHAKLLGKTTAGWDVFMGTGLYAVDPSTGCHYPASKISNGLYSSGKGSMVYYCPK